ncbi:MAG: hypothetical protein WCE64_10710, partial [Bacteroidales bacterium]
PKCPFNGQPGFKNTATESGRQNFLRLKIQFLCDFEITEIFVSLRKAVEAACKVFRCEHMV